MSTRRELLAAELAMEEASDDYIAAKAKGRGKAYDTAKTKLREARANYRRLRDGQED